MPLHPLLASRYSCRAFKPEPISDQALQEILEAARWAPSSYNDQPWSFIVAKREDTAAFETMLSCLGGNRPWCENASVILACLAVKTYTHDQSSHYHAWHDLGLAVMAMCLQSVSLGLQAREMAGVERDKIRNLYKVPDTHDIVTGLAIGHPATEGIPKDRGRKPLKEFIFQGEFGRS
jgi:nitroreductase